MERFIVTYENKQYKYITHEKILVNANSYAEARQKAEKWIKIQTIKLGDIIDVSHYHFKAEIH